MPININSSSGINPVNISSDNKIKYSAKSQSNQQISPKNESFLKQKFNSYNPPSTSKELNKSLEKAQQKQAQFEKTAHSEFGNRGIDLNKLMIHARSNPGFQSISFNQDKANNALKHQLAEFDRRMALPENQGRDPNTIIAEIENEFCDPHTCVCGHISEDPDEEVKKALAKLRNALDKSIQELTITTTSQNPMK